MLDKSNFEKSGNPGLQEMVKKDIYNNTCEGLRTLVMAMREVPSDEFDTY